MGWLCFWKRLTKGLFNPGRDSQPNESPEELTHTPMFSPYDIAGFWGRIHGYYGYKNASAEEKVEFLEFVLEVIKLDLQGSTLSSMFFQEYTHNDYTLFPVQGLCTIDEQTQEVPFEGNTVICIPHRMSSMMDAVEHINREGFQRKRGYYTGLYFTEIRFLMIQNGQHHSAVASIRGGGSATAEVYHLADAFEHLSVTKDYRSWTIDGKPDDKILDPRFALIYELAREICNLKNGKGETEEIQLDEG